VPQCVPSVQAPRAGACLCRGMADEVVDPHTGAPRETGSPYHGAPVPARQSGARLQAPRHAALCPARQAAFWQASEQ